LISKPRRVGLMGIAKAHAQCPRHNGVCAFSF
jgi:hypothetical protein